jgi:hypothetical protein
MVALVYVVAAHAVILLGRELGEVHGIGHQLHFKQDVAHAGVVLEVGLVQANQHLEVAVERVAPAQAVVGQRDEVSLQALRQVASGEIGEVGVAALDEAVLDEDYLAHRLPVLQHRPAL